MRFRFIPPSRQPRATRSARPAFPFKRIHHFLASHGVFADPRDASALSETDASAAVVVVTDGHLALRNVLHSEAAHRGLRDCSGLAAMATGDAEDGRKRDSMPGLASRAPWCRYHEVAGLARRELRRIHARSGDEESEAVKLLSGIDSLERAREGRT
ncbi:unnamed protein product [Protopolystoma xenopodis]|uniref:Uncharacterized protein n=1 Tax=Protopolystoma xenopodis TaxID=117903 RepID=A0A448X6I9_9PLAT|nr:unnamed protein product [Protopolystoma xenopodis]